MLFEIGNEASDAAKAADADGDRLRARVGDAAGIAQHGWIAARRQPCGERAGFAGAAEKQDGRDD